ncbi:MAG: hypothetical protein IT581_05715 [Verrucomicrobiales bacterium]|nr:hypothetical protein [Verrucomicrobiales bacterium]
MKKSVLGLGLGCALLALPASVLAYTNVPPGVTLWLQGYDQNPSSPPFRNEGTIKLECIDDALGVGLNLLDSGLENAATGLMLFNPGAGGGRFFTGRLLNRGEIEVNFPTLFHRPGTRVENEGQLLTTATAWTQFEGPDLTFVQRGGRLSTGYSFEMTDGTFEYEGGTVDGDILLIQSHLRVAETATNSLTARLLGPDTTFEGTLGAGQVLDVAASPDYGAGHLQLASGSVIQGRISLTSTNTNAPALLIANQGFTVGPQGSIVVEAGGGGLRQIQGRVDLHGTIEVSTDCNLSTGGGALTNHGTLVLRPGLLFPTPLPPSGSSAGLLTTATDGSDASSRFSLALADAGSGPPQRRSGRSDLGAVSLSTTPLRLCAFVADPESGAPDAAATPAASLTTIDAVNTRALQGEPPIEPDPPILPPITSYPRFTIASDLVQDTSGRMEFVIEPANGAWLAPVRVIGTARLAGSLKISLAEGSEVTVGRQFPLIAASRIRGGFTRVEFPAARPGQRWSIQVSAGILQAIVTSGPPRLSVYLDRQSDGTALLRINGGLADDIIIEQSVNLRNWTQVDGWFEIDGSDLIFGKVATTIDGQPAFFRARYQR